MLNRRLEEIYNEGLDKKIKSLSELKFEKNNVLVFDIESCGIENNKKALTYSIAVMRADSNEDVMYWTNSVSEFMDTILNVSCETIEIYAHNLFFDIKPFITYFINNYPANMLKNNIEETKI